MNKDALNIFVQAFFGDKHLFLISTCLGQELLDHRGVLRLIVLESNKV